MKLSSVEEADPGQQGLKPVRVFRVLILRRVEEADPGQQGLKHITTHMCKTSVSSKRLIQDNKD